MISPAAHLCNHCVADRRRIESLIELSAKTQYTHTVHCEENNITKVRMFVVLGRGPSCMTV
jgi:hypothetical protein